MTQDPPRDRLGRPLPAGTPSSAPPVPDVTGLSDDAVWGLGLALLGDGLPFHAHEVFEARWRDCAEPDRDAWRALAQWAAARTHLARGNAVGAGRLSERALQTLAAARTQPAGVDWAQMRSDCTLLASRALDGPRYRPDVD